VDAHRTIDIGITISQRFDVGGIFSADTNAQEVPYSTLARSFKGSVKGATMLGKVEAIKVAMGIYEHRNVQLESRKVSGRRYTVGRGN
jgi:hypothetical protein